MEQREKDQFVQQEEENKSLQRTKNMMRLEMERVSEVYNTIQTNTVTIKSTKDLYLGMIDSVKGVNFGLLNRRDMEGTIFLGYPQYFLFHPFYTLCEHV